MALRALVADDDPDLLETVVRVVDRFGLAVTHASCGGELLHQLSGHGPFDVVVTDVAMPWLTGLQVLQSARLAGLTCPVIVMTGMSDTKTRQQVAALGDAVIMLHKPFSVGALHAALVTLLREPVTLA
jgi:CheY-like chemotaxis protein